MLSGIHDGISFSLFVILFEFLLEIIDTHFVGLIRVREMLIGVVSGPNDFIAEICIREVEVGRLTKRIRTSQVRVFRQPRS